MNHNIYHCGALTVAQLQQKVFLRGWIAVIRKVGALTFINLSDVHGVTQLLQKGSLSFHLGVGYYCSVSGIVQLRKVANHNLQTGQIEVLVEQITVISTSPQLPFTSTQKQPTQEKTRLAWRFLDLRRPDLYQKLLLRSQVTAFTHRFFSQAKFIYVETPILSSWTPEGARNYLVPVNINQQKLFFALPQSPQLYKQLLMIGGIDRYYQLARVFRREDFRADRQLEFTQIDLEMSNVTAKDVMSLVEQFIVQLWQELLGKKISQPFLKMDYQEAISKYGSDRPDLRFQLPLQQVHDLPPYLGRQKHRAFFMTWSSQLKPQELLLLQRIVQKEQGNVLFWQYQSQEWKLLHYTHTLIEKAYIEPVKTFWSSWIAKQNNMKNGMFFIISYGAGWKGALVLGSLRQWLGQNYLLSDQAPDCFLWIVNLPMFAISKSGFKLTHHPFTAPVLETTSDWNQTTLTSAKARAYDLVINGVEIGSGSIRIHQSEQQLKMLRLLGLTEQQIKTYFGWFLTALRYGAPPHGGIALGLDRLLMVITNATSLRDVIAFPKNSAGVDLTTHAPTADIGEVEW